MGHKIPLWNKNFVTACTSNFLTACSFNLLMPTIPLYLTEMLGIAESRVGIVLSSYVLAMLFTRPFSGYLVDIFPRKILYLISLSLFVAVYFGYIFAATVLFFILLRFVHGIFWAVTSVSANTVAIDIIPPSRRAEGIGFFGMFTNMAMAVAPFIALSIYHTIGFHWLVGSAIAMGMLAIIAASFIKVGVKPPKERPPLSFDRFILLPAFPIFLNQVLITFGWGTLIPFAALYGKSLGIENPGILFLFLALGIIVSRMVSGKVVDKGYLHQAVIFALTIICLGFVSYSFAQSLPLFCFSAFVIGIGFGTFFPAMQTVYVNMATSDKRGTASSTYLTAFDLGNGIGMLAGGYIISGFHYSTMYQIAAASVFLGLMIYIFNSKKVYDRKRLG